MRTTARAAARQGILLFIVAGAAWAGEAGFIPAGTENRSQTLAGRMNLTPERLAGMAEPLGILSASYGELAEKDPLKALYLLQEHARVSEPADVLLRHTIEYSHIDESEYQRWRAQRQDGYANTFTLIDERESRKYRRKAALDAELAKGLGPEAVDRLRWAAHEIMWHNSAVDPLEAAHWRLEQIDYAHGDAESLRRSLEEAYDGLAQDLAQVSWYAYDEKKTNELNSPAALSKPSANAPHTGP